MDVRMFQMGFGGSVLIHQGDNCRLADCGIKCHNRDIAICCYQKGKLLYSHEHQGIICE